MFDTEKEATYDECRLFLDSFRTAFADVTPIRRNDKFMASTLHMSLYERGCGRDKTDVSAILEYWLALRPKNLNSTVADGKAAVREGVAHKSLEKVLEMLIDGDGVVGKDAEGPGVGDVRDELIPAWEFVVCVLKKAYGMAQLDKEWMLKQAEANAAAAEQE